MSFSHHSHSGQFCPGHAKNSLEEMVQTAISKGMQVYALTEHMPRHEIDFYPEEVRAVRPWLIALLISSKRGTNSSNDAHHALIDAFHAEACRLRSKYASQITILVGFEGEWIRPESLQLIEALQAKHRWDVFVGSVHHVHTHPIDYDRKFYELARAAAGGTDERLIEDYFDAQYEMLRTLKPPVVAHFDLIRLLSEDCNQSFRQYDGVWTRIERNLRFAAEYGGILELNSAALRKGMSEPYPKVEICEAFLKLGGRFCLSDDAHAVEHVGQNYGPTLAAARKAGITSLHYFTPSEAGGCALKAMAIDDISIDKANAT